MMEYRSVILLIVNIGEILSTMETMEDISDTSENAEDRLWRHLMKERSYNPKVRPVLNVSRILNLTIDVALNQIIDFDEPSMVVTSETWMRLYWRDDLLTWDATEFGGLTSILLPASDVWLPDLSLYSRMKYNYWLYLSSGAFSTPYYRTGKHDGGTSTEIHAGGVFGNKNVLVKVTSDGNVTWLFQTVINSRCGVDMALFPFDTQRCGHEFGSWSYDGLKIDIHPIDTSGDRSAFMDNGEWELVNIPSKRKVMLYKCCPVPFPSVIYSYVLRRRPMYYFLNMIMPCFVITCVNLFSFLLPVQSGEKVTFNITTLLAMVVFLRMVAEHIPPQGGAIPVIEWYFISCILMLCLSTVVGVFVCRIHFAGESGKRFPVWARWLLYGPIGRMLCLQKFPYTDINQESKAETEKIIHVQTYMSPLKGKVAPLNNLTHRGTQTANHGTIPGSHVFKSKFVDQETLNLRLQMHEWRNLANFIDKCFFISFLLILLTISIYVLSFFEN